jgi:mono/diheme cytochrome c family protein
LNHQGHSTHKISLALLAALAFLFLAWSQGRAQTPSPDQLEEGARLYAENCAVCHGENGEGRVGATLAKDWPSIRPDRTIQNVIANGVPNSPMPAWSKEKGGPLAPEEIEALSGFILSWQTGGFPDLLDFPTPTPISPITPIPEVEGDPNHGAALYAENCAMCHGANGEGRVGATLTKDWPSIRPDLSIKTVVQNGVSGSPMPAWSAEKGGPLNESEINDIVAYVVSLPSANPPGERPEPDTSAEPPPLPAWMQGVAGLALFFLALLLIVGGILLFQKRAG